MTAITATLQSFFTDRLTSQRQASAHTIASYRDTVRSVPAVHASPHRQGAISAGLG